MWPISRVSPTVSLLALLLMACGPADPSAVATTTQAISGKDETPVWLAALPATLSQVNETASLEVHQCRISIGTALEMPPFPPLHHVWLRKEGCETGGYVLLGTSYSLPSTLLDGSKKGLVASFTFRSTPSGSAYEKAQLVAVDFFSGAIGHASTLGALPPFGSGLVEPDRLELRGDGTVLVGGQKNGVIPGEIGSGDQFFAVYEKFIGDDLFNPPPSLVLAF